MDLKAGILSADFIAATANAGPNITQKGIIIRLIKVYVKAVLPAIIDFPYSFPSLSLSITPSVSSLFLISVILVALAAETAVQLNRVEKIRLLAPLIHRVMGAKRRLRPTEMMIEALTAPV